MISQLELEELSWMKKELSACLSPGTDQAAGTCYMSVSPWEKSPQSLLRLPEGPARLPAVYSLRGLCITHVTPPPSVSSRESPHCGGRGSGGGLNELLHL